MDTLGTIKIIENMKHLDSHGYYHLFFTADASPNIFGKDIARVFIPETSTEGDLKF